MLAFGRDRPSRSDAKSQNPLTGRCVNNWFTQARSVKDLVMFPQSEAELLPLNDKYVPCNDNGSCCCRLLALALACCGLAAAMQDVAVNSSDELGTSSCYNKRVPHDVFCVGCNEEQAAASAQHIFERAVVAGRRGAVGEHDLAR